jgi:hypothetical protein
MPRPCLPVSVCGHHLSSLKVRKRFGGRFASSNCTATAAAGQQPTSCSVRASSLLRASAGAWQHRVTTGICTTSSGWTFHYPPLHACRDESGRAVQANEARGEEGSEDCSGFPEAAAGVWERCARSSWQRHVMASDMCCTLDSCSCCSNNVLQIGRTSLGRCLETPPAPQRSQFMPFCRRTLAHVSAWDAVHPDVQHSLAKL